MFELSTQQRAFFETFGYLVFPGLIKDDIRWIEAEFEQVFVDRGVKHDGDKRSCIVPFIDQRERLCTLVDHPALHAVATGVLGDNFNYMGSDGNYYTGNTPWHSDGFHTVGKYAKIAIYLDKVTRDTGCLRVIPGTHRIDQKDSWQATKAIKSEELWGIPQSEVPCVALESEPGDVVVFNHNLMHCAFGGSSRRRMFTLNLNRHCETAEEIEDMESYINSHARFWIDRVHSDTMRDTASEQRLRHLQQVFEHEWQLPTLAAKARAEMAEPSRG